MKTKKDRLIIGGIIVLYFITLMPYIMTILYALPCTDDFSVVQAPFFINAVKNASGRWFTWGGGWLFYVIQDTFNPLNFVCPGSLVHGIVLIISFWIFIISLSVFNITCLVRFFEIEKKRILALCNVILIFMVIFSGNYSEVFYWYIGNTYAVSMDFALLAISAMINYFYGTKAKKGIYVLLVILGMAACNAIHLCVVVGATYCLLAYLSVKGEGRRISVKEIFPVLMYVIVGCLTAFAPGNFARASTRKFKGASAAKVLVLTVRDILYGTQHVLENEIVILMLIGVFTAGVIFSKQYSRPLKRMWLAAPLGIVTLYGTIYPVTYGYGGGSAVAVKRIDFLVATQIILCLSIFLLWAGLLLGRRLQLVFDKKDAFTMSIVFVCIFYLFVIKDNSYQDFQLFRQVKNLGKVQKEHELWTDIYREIAESEEADVVITVREKDYVVSDVLENPDVREDKTWWINEEISPWFGKNSISVKIQPKDEEKGDTVE